MSTSAAQDQQTQHHAHQTSIVVNGRSVTVTEKELSYKQVVQLSGLTSGPDTIFTVTYHRGEGHKPSGSLVKGGEPVRVKQGMVFNVEPSNRS